MKDYKHLDRLTHWNRDKVATLKFYTYFDES